MGVKSNLWPTRADQERLERSLNAAVKYAKGEKAAVKVEALKVPIAGALVKEARKVMNASQPQFARILGVSPETVKKWEQGRNPVEGAAARWISVLLDRPHQAKALLLRAAHAMTA